MQVVQFNDINKNNIKTFLSTNFDKNVNHINHKNLKNGKYNRSLFYSKNDNTIEYLALYDNFSQSLLINEDVANQEKFLDECEKFTPYVSKNSGIDFNQISDENLVKARFINEVLREINDKYEINFVEETHKYYVKDKFLNKNGLMEKEISGIRSVSSYIQESSNKFNDADAKSNLERKYNINPELVDEKWVEARLIGQIQGTILHAILEYKTNIFLNHFINKENLNFSGIKFENMSQLKEIVTDYVSNACTPTKKGFEYLTSNPKNVTSFNKMYSNLYSQITSKEVNNITTAFDLDNQLGYRKILVDLLFKSIDIENSKIKLSKIFGYNNSGEPLISIGTHQRNDLKSEIDRLLSKSIELDNESFEKLFKKSMLKTITELNIFNNEDSYVNINNKISCLLLKIANSLVENKKLDKESTKCLNIITNEFYSVSKSNTKIIESILKTSQKLLPIVEYTVENLLKRDLMPVCSEVVLYNSGIIGTIDLLTMNKEGKLIPADLKTIKETMSTKAKYGKSMKNDIGISADNSYNHYSEQTAHYSNMMCNSIISILKENSSLRNKAISIYGKDYENNIKNSFSTPILVHANPNKVITERLFNESIKKIISQATTVIQNKDGFIFDESTLNKIEKLKDDYKKQSPAFDLTYCDDVFDKIVKKEFYSKDHMRQISPNLNYISQIDVYTDDETFDKIKSNEFIVTTINNTNIKNEDKLVILEKFATTGEIININQQQKNVNSKNQQEPEFN